LEASALNPVRFLVVPRLLATVIMTVMLTIIADVIMIGSGILTAVNLGIDYDTCFQLTREAVDITGFVTGLIKACAFGLLIGLIACFLGLSVKPWEGSDGVGHATTSTVVYSIVAIIGADAIFTVIFYSYGLFS
jgi:phospholipid/cholesterol/gamma-HCH transport system permease protein